MNEKQDELLTVEEAADRLKCSTGAVYAWLRTGKLKALRAGSLWRIRVSDLEEFLSRPMQKHDE